MAINLNKYRDLLISAWKDVLDDKTDTDWALFGYEGQSNDLKVVGSGSEGIEEMTEELNSGKIMYAFLKVNDPKTSLPKCVLINWQGEGANIVRKGICANHVRDVANFFTGAHLTLNARNEEEVEPQLIIDKVAKAGSAYSFKAPRSDDTGPTGPVGSNYKRINPIKEINSKERDQFWMKEEEEEKKRIAEEKKRLEAERAQLEVERKQRELLETQKRDAVSAQRNDNITKIKEAEKLAFDAQKKQENQEYYEEEISAVNKSEELRRQRKQEAQELISQRTINARSIFEQNTSAGQQMKCTPEKPVRNSLNKLSVSQNTNEIVKPDVVIQDLKITDDPQTDDECDQFSTIKRSPKDVQKVEQSPLAKEIETIQHEFEVTSAAEKLMQKEIEQVRHITEQQLLDEVIYQEFSDGPGLQARALYDYQAADDTEITFDPGDIITNIDQVDEGWWQGLGPDGTYGLFPANYVELLPEKV